MRCTPSSPIGYRHEAQRTCLSTQSSACLAGGFFSWLGWPTGWPGGVVHRCRGCRRHLSSRVEGDDWESIFEILDPVFQSLVSSDRWIHRASACSSPAAIADSRPLLAGANFAGIAMKFSDGVEMPMELDGSTCFWMKAMPFTTRLDPVGVPITVVVNLPTTGSWVCK
jgi:hypothetical protein